ncbi:hypothetical protein RJ639_038010 [Escallonia herrerae]|uniref:CCHC-type domain-containing protein n=1 Tax=Escallonia herrerae TaxID=1293975 RepID=A0AA89BAE7_9ASTE|nr:hypothetical protein RJ639_038010 [Escallonia herrerae]
MIAKNFKKFMRFRRNGGRKQQNASNEEKLCYKCHKPGHMKMDCPIYKREKKERRDVWERVKRRQLSKKENKEKEKAMNAEHTPTWSDFDSNRALNIERTLRFTRAKREHMSLSRPPVPQWQAGRFPSTSGDKKFLRTD